jgi:ketosteroid isomerase-like protein
MATTELDELVTTWVEAERRGDAEALDALLTDDFVGIGPVGFVLPKQAWLSRFAQGLRYEDLHLDEVSTRRHGDAALIVAHQHARGEHQGNPTPSDARVSVVATREAADDGRWRIVGVQYSFIAGTPGAPV